MAEIIRLASNCPKLRKIRNKAADIFHNFYRLITVCSVVPDGIKPGSQTVCRPC